MFKQVLDNVFEPDENMLPNVHGLNKRYANHRFSFNQLLFKQTALKVYIFKNLKL